MKKTICFILVLIALFSLPFTSFASSVDTSSESYIALHIDISKALVNGSVVDLTDGGESYAPFASGGRTFVPLRFVAEQLGGKVDWNNSTKQAVITIGSNKVAFTYGLKKYTVNGKEYSMDVTPMGVNGHTYIPVRFMCESIGKVVSYDNASGYIKIGDKNISSDELSFIVSKLGQYVESHYNENLAWSPDAISSDDNIYYSGFKIPIHKVSPDGSKSTALSDSVYFDSYYAKLGNYIYHRTSQGALNRFNLITGKDEVMLNVEYIGGVFMYGGKLYAVNQGAYAGFSTLYSYDQEKNKLTKLFDKKVESPVIIGNTIYFLTQLEGDLCKISLTGKDFTQLTYNEQFESLAYDGNSLYATSDKEGVVSIDFTGKNRKLLIPTGDYRKQFIYQNIAVRNSSLYYGIEKPVYSGENGGIAFETRQTMYRYDLRTGETIELNEITNTFQKYVSTDFDIIGNYIYGYCRNSYQSGFTDIYVFDMDGKLLNHVSLQ